MKGFQAEGNFREDRAARTVNRRDGKYDGPVPNVSQAPQAVRSAGGRRRIAAFLARTRANGTLHSDKRDAFRLAIPVHRLRYISRTVATRAEIQGAFSPSGLQALCTTKTQNLQMTCLRYESRTNFSIRGVSTSGSGPFWVRTLVVEKLLSATHIACVSPSATTTLPKSIILPHES